MSVIDRILLTLCSICLAILSIIMVIFPFGWLDFLLTNNMNRVLGIIKGNYIYSAVGLAFLLASIKLIILGLKGKKDQTKTTYLVQRSDYGEINISSNTIVGLTESVSNKFSGIRNIKTKVDILEGQLYIDLKGEVSPEIDITQTTKELQNKVKEHVEKCTGVNVNEIRVVISNVTGPVRSVK